MAILAFDKSKFDRKFKGPPAGNPTLHRELEWYATDDDQVIGVVVLDLIDKDFSWVVMTRNEQGPGFTAVDVEASRPTQEDARAKLHSAMLERKWED